MDINNNNSRRGFFDKLLSPIASIFISDKIISPEEDKSSQNNVNSLSKDEADEIIKNSRSLHLLRFVPKPPPVRNNK